MFCDCHQTKNASSFFYKNVNPECPSIETRRQNLDFDWPSRFLLKATFNFLIDQLSNETLVFHMII
jgi:hypothetical protein